MNLKSILSILFVIIISSFISSCTKEYTCRCTMIYSGAPGFDTTVIDYKLRDTEKNATSECEGRSAVYEYNGIVTEENCAIY